MKVIKIGAQIGDVQLIETNRELTELVGGKIQASGLAQLQEKGIELLCNDHSIYLGLKNNYNLFPFFFLGTCVMVGVDGEKFTSLSESQITFACEWLRNLDNGALYEVEQ